MLHTKCKGEYVGAIFRVLQVLPSILVELLDTLKAKKIKAKAAAVVALFFASLISDCYSHDDKTPLGRFVRP